MEEIIQQSDLKTVTETFDEIKTEVQIQLNFLDSLTLPDKKDTVPDYINSIKSAGKKHKEIVEKRMGLTKILDAAKETLMAPEKTLDAQIKGRKNVIAALKENIKKTEVVEAGKTEVALLDKLVDALALGFEDSLRGFQAGLVKKLSLATSKYIEGALLGSNKADISNISDVIDIRYALEVMLYNDSGFDAGVKEKVLLKLGNLDGQISAINTWYLEAVEMVVGDKEERKALFASKLDQATVSSIGLRIKNILNEELSETLPDYKAPDVKQVEADKQVVEALVAHLDQGGDGIADSTMYMVTTPAVLTKAIEVYLNDAKDVDLYDISEGIQKILAFAVMTKPDEFSEVKVVKRRTKSVIMSVDKAA